MLTCTKRGMPLRPRMTALLWASLANMWRAPTVPSTISSIRTPSTYPDPCPLELIEARCKWKQFSVYRYKQFQKLHFYQWEIANSHQLGQLLQRKDFFLDRNRISLGAQLTLCVSWWALMRRWTILGSAPCSLNGAWFAGQRARFLMRPTTALMSGHLLGGWSNLTRTGSP